MMTHDLEPIIDFVVNNKPTGGFVRAYHLQKPERHCFRKTDK